MYTIGLSSCGTAPDENLFIGCAKSGIGAVEVSIADECGKVDLAHVKRMADNYGVRLWSYHLPYYPFERIDPSSLDAAVRENTVKAFTRMIGSASEIGIDKFVVHPSGEPIPDVDRAERIKRSTETLAALAEIAAGYGAVIAVEDLPRTCLGNCSDEILTLLSGSDKLRVCFDTNHLLTESADRFISRVGSKIITLHVSDYDFINERHWLPGEGKQRWDDILRGLGDIGYSGVWMYELGFTAPKTMPRSRDLTCDDFCRNFREITAGGEITRI